MRLSDRIAVVTGAGSGIGHSIARLFASEGATVAALDIRGETAEQTVKELAGSGHRAFPVDVSSGPDVVETFAAIDRAFGRVDVLVNNAGIDRAPGDGFEEAMKTGQQLVHMSDEGFTRMMEINVNGVFFCTREAAKLMLREQRGGAIVNMSSIAGLSAMGTAHYAASKAAVLGLTRACARELGPRAIRVNAICPGVIDTPMTDSIPDAAVGPLIGATPLRRKGQPGDIASAALYLASDESSFVTGQWLSPNGGLVMC
ncbi:MAG: glucose 1-dehydrogenase [Myxococcota bacterium]|nr:glucose 1-dehydrogenase [Myxococcota bacterium]